jgi:hypothetical protein
MPREKRVLEPGALFKRTLLSPNNEELLRKVKERAAAIMHAFDQPDDIDLTQDELKNLNPLWVARVYEAVAPTSFSAAYDENDHLYAHAEEEEQIGVAYKLSLLPGLPVHLADLSGQWLVKVPLVDKEEMNDVLNSPSAVAAEPLSRDLARYGVAPLTVLDATDAVARLVERCVRSGRVNGNEAIVLSSQQVNGEVLNTQLLTDEVSRVAECREPTARVLLDWSIEVARFKPFLFDGFTAESSGPEALMLFRTGEKLDNLHERWGRSVSGTITKQATVEMYNVGQFRMDT